MTSSIGGPEEISSFLKRKPLRNFAHREVSGSSGSQSHRFLLERHDFPVPRLLAYALRLGGIQTGGPAEKVEWWATFSYRGIDASIAHAKFGLKLFLYTAADEDERNAVSVEICRQLQAATRAVERMLRMKSPELLAQGNATVVNQHFSLSRTYAYFRERALCPAHIEDEYEVLSELPSGIATASIFQSGELQMQTNAFYDMVAATMAYLSRFEHELVLTLAFSDFDPGVDDLSAFIGSKWGDKFNRVLGGCTGASRYRRELTAIVERWRNPYAHGGFDKQHGASLYFQVPDVGTVPVGLTKIRESPHFSFMPATESTIEEVFQMFDEVDSWMRSESPEATKWIQSGLDVRFDAEFRRLLEGALKADKFDDLLAWVFHGAG